MIHRKWRRQTQTDLYPLAKLMDKRRTIRWNFSTDILDGLFVSNPSENSDGCSRRIIHHQWSIGNKEGKLRWISIHWQYWWISDEQSVGIFRRIFSMAYLSVIHQKILMDVLDSLSILLNYGEKCTNGLSIENVRWSLPTVYPSRSFGRSSPVFLPMEFSMNNPLGIYLECTMKSTNGVSIV